MDDTNFLQCDVEKAIELEWPLREISGQAYSEKGKMQVESKLIKKGNTELHEWTTGVAIMPNFIKNFVSIDCDFLDKDLKKEVRGLLKEHYDPNKLFIRMGNRDKLGQFYFFCEEKVRDSSQPGLDIIVKSKRCDALGWYGKDKTIKYYYPKMKITEHGPDKLPIITLDLINQIRKTVADYYGEEIDENTNTSETGGRHDFMRNLANKRICRGDSPGEVYRDILQTSQYEGVLADRPETAHSDLVRSIHWCVDNTLNEDFKTETPVASPYSDFIGSYPEVEKQSLLDFLYMALKRNQIKESKQLAFFSSLSLVSWLLSFSTRFCNMSTNLMILYVAKSGAGKSDNGKLIYNVANLDFRLIKSIVENINSSAQLSTSFENTPNSLFIFNEFSEVLKKEKSGKTMAGVSEKMMKLYNDYPDDRLHYESLKETCYGVCYGPKLNALMFTSPANFSSLDPTAFEGGLGRRTFTIVDDNTYLLKKGRNNSGEYFNKLEKLKIKEFIDKYIFTYNEENTIENGDNEFEDWSNPYIEKDISHFRLVKEVYREKGQRLETLHEKAKAPNILNTLTKSREVEDYLANGHIDKINNLIKEASKTANIKKEVVINSFGEFTIKFAAIHSLAGKTIPSLVVEMDSIKWAEAMVEFYIVHNFSGDLDRVYKDSDKEANQIVKASKQFLNKLTEKEVTTFNLSNPVCLSFFQNARRTIREDIFTYLVANNEITLENFESTKNSRTYKVVTNKGEEK